MKTFSSSWINGLHIITINDVNEISKMLRAPVSYHITSDHSANVELWENAEKVARVDKF